MSIPPNAISIRECLLSIIQDFHSEKQEIDAAYSRICQLFDEQAHVLVANDDEWNELYKQILYYKNTMKQIVCQMRNLVHHMQKDANNVQHNPSSLHLTRMEQEERQIDEIIRPFLLPILLRSIFIQNISHSSDS